MNFTILKPFWHRAGLVAEQSRAEPSRAEPSRAEPGRAEPSRAESGRAHAVLTGGREVSNVRATRFSQGPRGINRSGHAVSPGAARY